MGTRDRIAERCRPFLGDDVEVEYCFAAQAAGYHQYRIVVLTSDEIVVLDNKFFGLRPKEMLRRWPRNKRLGPLSWYDGVIRSLGKPLHVKPRWVPQVWRADAALEVV